MSKLVFLDFDGVMRRVTSMPPSRFDNDCLQHFESAMRQDEKSKIVISSTWRLAMSLKEIRSHFSADIAARIVGVTPETLEDETFARYVEILAFLQEKKVAALPWVAIDDDATHFPPASPVLLVDPNKGFDAVCELRLVQMMRS